MNTTVQTKEGMRSRTRKQPLWLPRAIQCMSLLLMTLALLIGGALTVSAAQPREVTPVRWNSTAGATALSDDAYLIDGVTYVPFRAFTVLADNCEVSWNGKTRTAVAVTSRGVRITAAAGQEYIGYGERYFFTAAPNRIIGDRLYVAIRPLAKCFAIDVNWNAASRSIALVRTGKTVRSDEGFYDSASLYWLSHIIGAEAKGEPFRGQLAVGNVVLNRVASQKYPNTIYEVIFDKKYGVQFTPSVNGAIYDAPPASAVIAAKICLEGYSLSDRILYFFNPSIATSHWISNNCVYAFRIGGHVFYR